uniref:Uncharacterized protein n=1 Tax=Lactuca sativa TaxID=4236 RepID=A0A9R1VE61_LACSA|nr:hypothetical protein LSAT_V11C500281000 [Lactuca sativa]
MLGLPSGGSLLSNIDYISENNEESCMFEWKKQYENIDKLRLKQLKNELVQTSAADDNFIINFLVLFINSFCESTSMGKCNLNPLYLIRRDTDLSSIDWCDYIVDCLLLYVDAFKFDHVQVTRKRPTIFYSMSEKIRFLEDILQESGGFGCGHVNEAYVEEEFQESEYNEEESGGNEVESDGEEDLCDEDEEDFDVNKVSDVEIMIWEMLKIHDMGSDPHEGNIGKNHVEGKGDDDEDDEQGNGSGCDKEEAMNLNYVVENVTKSVGTVNLGENDHKNKDGDCSTKNTDSNETRSLKNDIVPSFSLGFSQDSEGSKKSSQSQISSERMTKKKIKGRVIFGKPSAGPECVITNVDVIDASPVSFAPPLGTLEGPSKPVSGKPKDINEEATSVADIKGKTQMKFSYVYKSPFKERLIDFKPSLTQVENVVCKWLFNLQGNPGFLDSWSRILNHQEKFKDVNSPLKLFMNSDTTLSFEYTHLNETAKYKVFKDSFSRSISGDTELKVLKDVDLKHAFEVIDNGADDANFDDKYEKDSKWKCGLPKEGGSQEKILEKLRMKYAATILTSEINTKRDDVLKAAYEYQKVDQKIRDKHSYDAQWNIERRLSKCF